MKKYISFLFAALLSVAVSSQTIDEAWVKQHYCKTEVMIPMRDGMALYTAIYAPKSQHTPSPVLMMRTPYRCAPYGEGMSSLLWTQFHLYAEDNYVIVIQDVRGKGKSQGEFVNIRPLNARTKQTNLAVLKATSSAPQTQRATDEATDTYDAVEWLVHQVKNINGNVALIGSSYPGFYAMLGGLSGHPAIKAVVPEAPVTDWFMGDDLHHNGALMLSDAFRFLSNFDRVTLPGQNPLRPYKSPVDTDEYSFFLRLGSLKNITDQIRDSVKFWNEIMQHPNYDAWWQQRDVRRSCYRIKPAVLVVGGLFDAEDSYGTWQLYRAIRKQSPQTPVSLCVGPWWHSAWNKPVVESFADYRYGVNTAEDYRKNIEFPFVQSHLRTGSAHVPVQVNCYLTGVNQWKQYACWPPQNVKPVGIYLQANQRAAHAQPESKSSFSAYVSDPENPVPYTQKMGKSRPKEYMAEDQRFVEKRKDVLTFTTDALPQDLCVTGAPQVDLYVSSNTTDADFIVKIIDQLPGGPSYLVRGDVMRARYRNSFEHPSPMKPNVITRIRFDLPDISHVFQKGHCIQIQIQSSWFPLIDRNPQQFVPIYGCTKQDFIPAKIRIYHQRNAASRVVLPVNGILEIN